MLDVDGNSLHRNRSPSYLYHIVHCVNFTHNSMPSFFWQAPMFPVEVTSVIPITHQISLWLLEPKTAFLQ